LERFFGKAHVLVISSLSGSILFLRLYKYCTQPFLQSESELLYLARLITLSARKEDRVFPFLVFCAAEIWASPDLSYFLKE
jgi:hypothetical protein